MITMVQRLHRVLKHYSRYDSETLCKVYDSRGDNIITYYSVYEYTKHKRYSIWYRKNSNIQGT